MSMILRRSCLAVWLAAFMLSACGSDKDSDNSNSSGGRATDDDDDNASAGSSQGTGGSSDGGGAAIAPIVINELMPSNHDTVADNSGAYADWIELYNPTKKDVDLGGYYVSDSGKEPTRFALAKGLMIEAKGYLLLWADGDTDQGKAHLPFKLSADKEGAFLSGPDGALLDSIKYKDAQQDYSFARMPNGDGEFTWCAKATPGDANPDKCPATSSGSTTTSTGGSTGSPSETGGSAGAPSETGGGAGAPSETDGSAGAPSETGGSAASGAGGSAGTKSD